MSLFPTWNPRLHVLKKGKNETICSKFFIELFIAQIKQLVSSHAFYVVSLETQIHTW